MTRNSLWLERDTIVTWGWNERNHHWPDYQVMTLFFVWWCPLCLTPRTTMTSLIALKSKGYMLPVASLRVNPGIFFFFTALNLNHLLQEYALTSRLFSRRDKVYETIWPTTGFNDTHHQSRQYACTFYRNLQNLWIMRVTIARLWLVFSISLLIRNKRYFWPWSILARNYCPSVWPAF